MQYVWYLKYRRTKNYRAIWSYWSAWWNTTYQNSVL